MTSLWPLLHLKASKVSCLWLSSVVTSPTSCLLPPVPLLSSSPLPPLPFFCLETKSLHLYRKSFIPLYIWEFFKIYHPLYRLSPPAVLPSSLHHIQLLSLSSPTPGIFLPSHQVSVHSLCWAVNSLWVSVHPSRFLYQVLFSIFNGNFQGLSLNKDLSPSSSSTQKGILVLAVKFFFFFFYPSLQKTTLTFIELIFRFFQISKSRSCINSTVFLNENKCIKLRKVFILRLKSVFWKK